jgi:transposase
MIRHKKAPTGDEFMPGTSTEDIERRYKEQLKLANGKRDTTGGVNRTNSKYILILLACIQCRAGMKPMKIAEMLCESPGTMSGWLSRMHKGGLDALYDQPKSGRPPKIDPNLNPYISESIDKQPSGLGMTAGVWSAKTVLLMLSTFFCIDNISQYTAYTMLHRMDKSWKKLGRRIHPKSPTKEVKTEFMKELEVWVKTLGKLGFKMAFVDEAHLSTATILGKTWLQRGVQLLQKAVSHGQRRTCFAAIGEGGVIYKFYDRGNTPSMSNFVTHLHKELGKVLLVMDNASYHKSAEFKKHIRSFGGDVIIIFLPPYSPELNPVEMLWREYKRYIANKLYTNMNDMISAMDEMLADGIIDIPAMPECVQGAPEWEPQKFVNRAAIALAA